MSAKDVNISAQANLMIALFPEQIRFKIENGPIYVKSLVLNLDYKIEQKKAPFRKKNSTIYSKQINIKPVC